MLYYLMKNDRKVRITMNKKDILEIKRRFKKEACTFTRMCGCYVDADRNKITKIGETFLNLEDEEFYKYLEIAKKVLSGTIGNNLLELEFPLAEEAAGGRQQFLMGLRESRLKNDDLMDTFYDMIIDSYDYVGNYLILIFPDHILDDVLEGEFLFCRGKLSTAAKTGFHKFRMRCLGIPCIKHNRVDVCASVGKCREYKTGVRCADNPVTDTWTYAVFVLTVAKSRFGQVDRADRTQQIFVNFLRLV